MSTKNELVTRCETRFRDPNNDIITEAQWKSYIDDGYERVIGANPNWPFLEEDLQSQSVSSGSRTVTISGENAEHIKQVYNTTDDYTLWPVVNLKEVHSHFTDEDDGEPEFYRIIGLTTIELWPLPDKNINLDIIIARYPGDLGDAAEPPWPEQYHKVLVEYALARAYEDDADLDRADRHDQRFAAIVKEMQFNLLSSREDSYPTIVDNWFDT